MSNGIEESCNCSICEKEIQKFQDELEKWEYETIGLCTDCIDRIFKVYSPSFEDID